MAFDKQMPLWKLGAILTQTEDKKDRIAIRRLMNTKRLHYRLGWIAVSTGQQLEPAENEYRRRHGDSLLQDFLDGYDDHSHNRGFGHLEQCPDHAAGTCDPSKGVNGVDDLL